MSALEAMNNGDGTMTVAIREQAHIDWLRARGVKAGLYIGDVLLENEDRRRVYPTLTEAMEPAIAKYLDVLENDYQDMIALNGVLT